ncbi:hypothetical protein BC827DRAFT_493423 [Russula dissimulans]|nr:hypothetical protein BC827DRAFT_493423 [Russula dissimulans]
MIPLIILAASSSLASAFTINTPTNPVVCQPLQFTWSTEGSQSPYFLSLLPGGQPTAPAFKQFPPQQGSSYVWVVDLGVGTTFTALLKDGNGQQVYSAPATVQNGSDTSCVNDEVMEGKGASAPGPASLVNSSPQSPGVAAINHDASSNAAAASGSTAFSSASAASASLKSATTTTTTKPSSGALPSQTVKSNSVALDVSSGAIVGIMFSVGLTSILVSLVI